MATVQIGKYKRPGEYTEEFDNSQLQNPPIDNTVRALVLGVSKKGPINRPVELKSIPDLQAIFGNIDRNLESKGSYFHRTIAKLLETTPVLAMNLLDTDDTLDLLEFKSVSTSTAYTNGILRTDSYRKFHDNTGFWKRSTDAFLTVTAVDAGNTNRVLHFTNFSDRPITVFLFKSSITGFDTSALEWYGAIEKIPTYLYTTDFISDYMVDVIVVAGDFTNYNNLAVDKIWSKYFNRTGLIKTQVTNFMNEKNLTLLKYYTGLSLIPYFRDLNNKNIFIENNINSDTDSTGLFCTFNIDKLESASPNGLVDLVGNNLITGNTTSIEYLSYNEVISEKITFTNSYLDTVGNVIFFGNNTTFNDIGNNRTVKNAVDYVSNVTYTGQAPTSSVTGTFSVATASFAASNVAYAIYGSNKLNLLSYTASFAATDYVVASGATGATQMFTEVFVINSSGQIKNKPTNSELTNGIILGYLDLIVKRDAVTASLEKISSVHYNPVSVDINGFVSFGIKNDTTSDIQVTTASTSTASSVTYEFLNTSGTIAITDYVNYRKLKTFNKVVAQLGSSNLAKMATIGDGATSSYVKVPLDNVTVSITNNSLSDKIFTVYFPPAQGLTDFVNGFPLYLLDNEFILGTDKMITKNNPPIAAEGIIAKYSNFYLKYFNGSVNTADFFYENLLGSTVSVSFLNSGGNNYIGFGSAITFNTADKIIIPDSVLNTGVFTITNPVANTSSQIGYFSYLVTETVVAETLASINNLYNANTTGKHYLQLSLLSGILTAKFTESTLTSIVSTANTFIDVFSQESNFRQSVDIIIPDGYVVLPNKILVDGSRFSEITVGDFLEAVVPDGFVGTPKHIARIIKKQVSVDFSPYVELTCDSEIKRYHFGSDYQTYRFSAIDDFINTYKGITLKGFKTRDASLPDGTETRQTNILSIVTRGTNLFKAITDRENIGFRYLVDAFGLGLKENSKQELIDICGQRLDCVGFINMPSMKDFKNSSSPTFVDNSGVLQTGLIAQGGDPDSNPAFLYSFGQGDGSTSVGYFAPYVTINDNGRPRNVPPAPYVAAAYLRKFSSNLVNVTPWTVVAGVNDGRITGIAGLEMYFNNDQIIDILSMKSNPIVTKNNRGFALENELTAQSTIKSALAYIHVREVLISLESDLRDMLLNFEWKYNTPETRAEIKLRADLICEGYVSRNGLYNFFNKIDSENNTQEMIDNQLGVIQTFVEPIKTLSVIVNQISIEKTGTIQSGGFK